MQKLLTEREHYLAMLEHLLSENLKLGVPDYVPVDLTRRELKRIITYAIFGIYQELMPETDDFHRLLEKYKKAENLDSL